MQEFSALSVSSYEAGSLADRLTEQSRDGWSVVAIVPTGSTVTAYLCRESDGSTIAPVDEPTPVTEPAAEPAPESTEEPEPALPMTAAVAATQIDEPAAEPAPEPAAETATITDTAATAETTTADTGAAGTATSTTAASTAGAAPAGWYADPSGRFELRYWDGGQWTEHVSRAGQQYTDPPVA